VAQVTEDDGFHEIQLNGKQLVFLFMAATLVSVVIFLLVVFVGRGVRTDRGVAAEATTISDATPAAVDVPLNAAPLPCRPDPIPRPLRRRLPSTTSRTSTGSSSPSRRLRN